MPFTREHFIVAAATACTVLLAVLLHYEASLLLTRFAGSTRVPPRPRMLALVCGLLAAHVAEIWLFGVAAWLLLGVAGTGSLTGATRVGLFDAVYVSAATYTTLGASELAPLGHVRFLFGTESLVGLLLVAWSASLTFVEMQRHWEEDRK